MRRGIALAGLLLTIQGCGGLASIDPQIFPEPPRDAVTFWGHACAMIDLGGVRIVTDPVFEKKTLLRWRKVPMPPPETYADASIVLLSHAHPDHLSPPTLRTFPEDVVILCPERSAGHLEDLGREVRVMRPGDEHPFEGGKIVAVDAKHLGGRWSLGHGKTGGGSLGYVIRTEQVTLYYTGDTNLFPGIGETGAAHRPDVLLLNVNGHLHGQDAVRAAWASRATTVVPMHFGAYGYLFFPEYSRPRDHEAMERMLGDQLVVLGLGESLPLPPAPHSGSPLP